MNSFNLVDGINKTELPVGFDQMPLTNNLDVCFYFIFEIFFFFKRLIAYYDIDRSQNVYTKATAMFNI